MRNTHRLGDIWQEINGSKGNEDLLKSLKQYIEWYGRYPQPLREDKLHIIDFRNVQKIRNIISDLSKKSKECADEYWKNAKAKNKDFVIIREVFM